MISSQATSYWFTFKTTFLQQKKNGSYICLIQGNEHINTRPSDWKLNYVLLTNHKKKKNPYKGESIENTIPPADSLLNNVRHRRFLSRQKSFDSYRPFKDIPPGLCLSQLQVCVFV